ncbi:MAG: substrate-binding domain-containing protein [Fibrobacteria bacterium]|nr:substrate-binding domain-containing protein [Fibrobacteria bacterium]
MLILGLLLHLSCKKKQEQPPYQEPALSSKEFAVIQNPNFNGCGKLTYTGAKDAIKKYKPRNVEVTVKLAPPPTADSTLSPRSAQINTVLQQLKDKVDGILLDPVDEIALIRPVKQASSQDIPVVIFNSNLADSSYPFRYFENDSLTGAIAATFTADIIDRSGNMLLIRYMEDNPRTKTIEDVFFTTLTRDFPGIRLLNNNGGEQYAGPSAETAYHIAENLLILYPQVTVVFCSHESLTKGILNAVRDINKSHEIKIVGPGTGTKLLSALEESELGGIILPNCYDMGYEAMKHLLSSTTPEFRQTSIAAKMLVPDDLQNPDIQKMKLAE